MRTFIDLYDYLSTLKSSSLLQWVGNPWEGKNKLESLFRLFAGLGLIPKLTDYRVCSGNFNMESIQPHTSSREVFYNEGGLPICLKDSGDSSDLTALHRRRSKHLLLTTSKDNKHGTTVGKLDVEKIILNFIPYEEKGYTMTLCVVVPDRVEYNRMLLRAQESSHVLVDYLTRKDTVVVCMDDIDEAYHTFKRIYSGDIQRILKWTKRPLLLKMHQRLCVTKTLSMEGRILWGHIPRSGKSYILAGCIAEDARPKTSCNYLILTLAPNETRQQYQRIFDEYEDFSSFRIIMLDGKTTHIEKLSEKNIVFCSEQFLRNKLLPGNQLQWLVDLPIDMEFLDESHHGGTTPLAKEVMSIYGSGRCMINMTGTYSKPVVDWGIPHHNCILWDLEDIILCKNYDTTSLINKHGNDISHILTEYSKDTIVTEYSKYPSLHILTHRLTAGARSEALQATSDNDYGWSTRACLTMVNGGNKFQDEGEILKLWYNFFGKKNKMGVPDPEYPDRVVMRERINTICQHKFSRPALEAHDPMVIMAFLPPTDIDRVSQATRRLLETHNVIPHYDIVCINSSLTHDPKGVVEDARKKARIGSKQGLLVLSGLQCSLGVSIDNCDVVLLLTGTESYDNIFQMMFRSMTDGPGKTCGFVVDFDLNRVLSTTVLGYAKKTKPRMTPGEAVRYLHQARIINLNCDHWDVDFGHAESTGGSYAEAIYSGYTNCKRGIIQHLLQRLYNKVLILSTSDQKFCNSMFTSPRAVPQSVHLDEEPIKEGIEKTRIDKDPQAAEPKPSPDKVPIEEVETKSNYMDIFRYIMPLMCLLTIHSDESSFLGMMDIIRGQKILNTVLIAQTTTWWGRNINLKTIDNIVEIYKKYMETDSTITEIIETIKGLFKENVHNTMELSLIVDKYLVPQEMERKHNAEVSTPRKLRQEMLDKVPKDFWEGALDYHTGNIIAPKTLEPCCGKGGFVIDIVERYMSGLSCLIPSEEDRYKFVVEECLYFADINPTNIFICKLLLDPKDQYNLNYYTGDTLELNPLEEWEGITGFGAVIGNPPYQAVTDEGISKGGGNNLYTKFIYYADNIILQGGYLLFINPPTYFGPGRSVNKTGMHVRADVLDKYCYHHINLEECARHFTVGSKFIYYLIQKSQQINSRVEIVCMYKGNLYKTQMDQIQLINRPYLPYLLTGPCMAIMAKIRDNPARKLPIFNSVVFDKRRPHVLNRTKKETDFEYRDRALQEGYPHPIQATGVQVVYSSKKCQWGDTKKVLMSESGYLRPFYDNGVLGVGGHCFACLVNSSEEGDQVIKLLKSPLYRFYVETNKWSGFHHREVLQDLPWVDSDDLYKHFSLTLEEISLVEEVVN